MINPVQSAQIAIGSIKSARMRSALTTLGIIIGVAAVVANVSLGASFNQYFADEIGLYGPNFIMIYGREDNIFFENELELVKNTPGIVDVSPVKGNGVLLRSNTCPSPKSSLSGEFSRIIPGLET
ncbi:MAG: ABC transporter permease [Euryarchaeota archaeon]|nr:ABC transporter permease [Euryarchaeota archaeon]